ncbi:MAG: hypothetical protein R3D57_13735 [Hyphomicrobiaceae bacterium]
MPEESGGISGVYRFLAEHGLLNALGTVAVLLAVTAAFRRFMRTQVWHRIVRALTEDVLTNWRLMLLGVTGIMLSLASGYTTWDGMTNFTCPARGGVDACFAPKILSLLITFGIQGVMLIAAWLIGESFAAGMHRGQAVELVERHRRSWAHRTFVGLLVLGIFAGALVILGLVLLNTGVLKSIGFAPSLIKQWNRELIKFAGGKNEYLFWSIAAFFGVLALLYAISEREIFGPYVRGLKIVLRSLPVWLMFLACMTTSVFFSFDSLFSTIFTPEERTRAAELRTTNQIAGLVSDVGALAATRQSQSVESLFDSPEWKTYVGQLDGIIDMARRAPGEIEALRNRELEAARSKQASLQERKATAESQRVRLAQRKTVLLEDVNRLKSEIPPLSAEVERLKADIFRQESDILAKKAEADAEAGGVGGTLKAGKGPEFAKRQKELLDLETKKKIVQDQLDAREAQLGAKRDGVASAEAELAQIDGEIGKLTGEAQLAEQQIAEGTSAGTSEQRPASDVTKVFGSLETALTAFRREPDRPSFEAIQVQCNALVSAFQKVETLKSEQVNRGLGCDSSIVADQVGRIFAQNEGIAAFKSLCGQESSLPKTGTDAVITFGEKCIQVAALSGEDTAVFRDKINAIGLARDDKAHRFVVTINAFNDGNQLAYLALAIAIAIDSLVFMSGLFGANAVRSPLTDVPHGKMRSASQLEAVIISALEPHRFHNARAVIGAMRPITPTEGFTQEVVLTDIDEDTAARVRTVLNAASTLSAVRRQDDAGFDVATGSRVYRERYLVRSELFEFLSDVCQRELRSNEAARDAVAEEQHAAKHYRLEASREGFESDLQRQRAERLVPLLRAALLPNLQANLAHLESALRPVTESEYRRVGFVTEAEPQGLEPTVRVVVVSALNAGATKGAVEHATIYRIINGDRISKDIYFVRPEFMAALTFIKLHIYDRGFKPAPEMVQPEIEATHSIQQISAQKPLAELPSPGSGAERSKLKLTAPSTGADDRDALERNFMREFAKALDFDAGQVVMVEQGLDAELDQYQHIIDSGSPLAHHAQTHREDIAKIIDETEFDLRQMSGDGIAKEALATVAERVRSLLPWLVNRRLITMQPSDQASATRQ